MIVMVVQALLAINIRALTLQQISEHTSDLALNKLS